VVRRRQRAAIAAMAITAISIIETANSIMRYTVISVVAGGGGGGTAAGGVLSFDSTPTNERSQRLLVFWRLHQNKASVFNENKHYRYHCLRGNCF